MAGRANNFDLKLLTSSKEVGLRRLRSYAAALGGGASIFHSFDELCKCLEVGGEEPAFNIVLHDSTLDLSSKQIDDLRRYARVFILQRPLDGEALPPATGACWHSESYYRCSLGALLESPIVRMSMAQMCHGGDPFLIEQLLRWGHAASTWRRGSDESIADHAIGFVRQLALVGEGRRVTEMFSHFVQTRLQDLQLSPERIVFGSDGLLLALIARCPATPTLNPRALAEELKVHDFPIAVVNHVDDGRSIEVAALHYPFAPVELLAERILMVFRKALTATAAAKPLEKAG